FEREIGQPIGDLFGGDVGGQVDVIPQPGNGDAHQTSIPKELVKRISPSYISRISLTSWRNITVRSMPIPNAKPEYCSGSTPVAASTRGLTMPQPPHSIQPSPRHVRQCVRACGSSLQTKQRRSTSALGS